MNPCYDLDNRNRNENVQQHVSYEKRADDVFYEKRWYEVKHG